MFLEFACLFTFKYQLFRGGIKVARFLTVDLRDLCYDEVIRRALKIDDVTRRRPIRSMASVALASFFFCATKKGIQIETVWRSKGFLQASKVAKENREIRRCVQRRYLHPIQIQKHFNATFKTDGTILLSTFFSIHWLKKYKKTLQNLKMISFETYRYCFCGCWFSF